MLAGTRTLTQTCEYLLNNINDSSTLVEKLPAKKHDGFPIDIAPGTTTKGVVRDLKRIETTKSQVVTFFNKLKIELKEMIEKLNEIEHDNIVMSL